MSINENFKKPQRGSSLMLAFQGKTKSMLILGENNAAASRVLACLEADAKVYLIANPKLLCPELKFRVENMQITLLTPEFDINILDRYRFDLGFICCNTMVSSKTLETIVLAFRQKAIPINVLDRPDLCDFFMTSTYRDQSLQISVSTNGQGCKLSNRIRRQIVSSLPPCLGDAVKKMGILRKKVRKSDPSSASSIRRMKWLAQIGEYWSMSRIAQLSEKDMESLLETYNQDEGYESVDSNAGSEAVYGSISLVGAGTGDPNLLTIAAYQAIKKADLVLADKIVPAEVVNLVECELKIARKFPGNADLAQAEFNEMALKAVRQGKNVVRLKQGDPYLFGRGGEEVLFFRRHNIVPQVIPGISSAVAAPLLAGIPLTHRSVASQFLVTTGTGAQNSLAPLPTYEKNRTDVFLMAIHRLEDLTRDLITKKNYPPDIPCAIIERASCKDQRVVWGALSNIVHVLERSGGSCPPGLLVVGYTINVLKHKNRGVEGVVSNLTTSSGETVERDSMIHDSNLLQLHDPECIY
ncbi:tetrapyrrole methylase [Sporodiniella umbellata]|nr:tetrapyrrole methylase [Sporodiniella umbellata]